VSITYDLYIKQSGRWLLEKQFIREERSDAVSEAERVLSLPGVAAVRVIRERFDRRTNMATEHTVFDSNEDIVPAKPQAHVRREFGRRGQLPPDVHQNWLDESDVSDQVFWDDMSLFDDHEVFEPWQTMSDEALNRVRSWARMASICVCGGGVGLLLIGTAWMIVLS
jgi:hypothetical protein